MGLSSLAGDKWSRMQASSGCVGDGLQRGWAVLTGPGCPGAVWKPVLQPAGQ